MEIDIYSFTKDKAAEFIQTLTGIKDHFDEACQIGTRLSRLPLVLA